jgi:protein TonB
MFRQPWPLWPLVSSCGLHAVLLALPVALAPQLNPAGTGLPSRLDARLVPGVFATPAASKEDVVPDNPPPAPDQTVAADAPGPMPKQPSLALLVPDRYFASAEVDQKAEPIDVAPLIYPEEAYLRRIPGRVTLRVFLDETGAIDGIDVLAAEPPGMFEQAAVDAVLATRFSPALLFSRPVKNVKTVEIKFDPLNDR